MYDFSDMTDLGLILIVLQSKMSQSQFPKDEEFLNAVSIELKERQVDVDKIELDVAEVARMLRRQNENY